MSKPRLTQLPNGNWLDLDIVQAILFYPKEQGFTRVIPDRVVLHFERGHAEMLPFESAESAKKCRDEIAAAVNSDHRPG